MRFPALARLNGRYALLAAGFLVLAVVRFGGGTPVWGVVFTVAAGVNVWLSVYEGRRWQRSAGDAALPPRRVIARSWRSHSGSLRRWRGFAVVATGLAAALLFVEPGLAVFAAAAALFCLLRARRARRDTDTLRRTLDTDVPDGVLP